MRTDTERWEYFNNYWHPRIGAQFGMLVVQAIRQQLYIQRPFRTAFCLCILCNETCAMKYRTLAARGNGCCQQCLHAGFPSATAFTVWHRRWKSIVCRCYNADYRDYCNYGGRSIVMCAAWLADKRAFFDYAQTLLHWDDLGLELDRIDNNKNYEPGNLQLTTRLANVRNQQRSTRLQYNGELLLATEFHAKYTATAKLSYIRRCARRGLTGEQILVALQEFV